MVNRWLDIALARLRGIEPYEVEQVLGAPRRLPRAGIANGIPVVLILARTSAGRPLTVAVHKDGPFDQDIIGARDMNPDELAVFEQWEANQP